MSKKDLTRHKQSIKKRVEELVLITKMDPCKKNFRAHEELADLQKKLKEME